MANKPGTPILNLLNFWNRGHPLRDSSIAVPQLIKDGQAPKLKWAGQWNSRYGWDFLLYVEKLDKDSAQIVQSWGEYNTSKMSCHCEPDWARVQKAKATYREGKATIEFITPNLQSRIFKRKMHTLSGENEGWVSNNPKGHGYYDFSYTVKKNEPNIMKGHFISGKNSHLFIETKRID